VYGTQPVIDPNDLDSDGVPNTEDTCPNTPLGATVDANGCEIFVLPINNFRLQIASETCRNSNNGIIDIMAQKALNYTATITGNGLNNSEIFTTTFLKSDLEAGDYRVCITVEGQADYEQCFNVSITEPEDLSVTSKVIASKNAIAINLNGGDSYVVTLNGVTTETSASAIELPLQFGTNTINVKTDKDCQGKYEETIFYGEGVMAFPNPISNELNVYLGEQNITTSVEIYSVLGNKVFSTNSNERNLNIDTSRYSKGIYILRVSSETTSKSFKIIKK